MHFKLFQKRESVKFDYDGKLLLNSAASPNAARRKSSFQKRVVEQNARWGRGRGSLRHMH